MLEAVLIAVLLVGGIGLLAAVLLSVASTVFAVPVNEKEVAIRDVLPGANCGACGYSGCDSYAKALAEDGSVPPNLCRPGGTGAAAAISEILGVELVESERIAAFVQCAGDCDACKQKSEYQGIESCSAAKMLFGGPNSCTYGCLGCGDCTRACDYGAISVVNGVACVNQNNCVACGLCAAACPNHLIAMVPVKKVAAVACSNKDKGAVTRVACSKGCIGCMKCQKNCPSGAIAVSNFVARVDYAKCTGCGVCAADCPVKCIKMVV